ncbi:LiaI-LiaF-like domain-containing protein [Chloroflexota bacterium]
MSEQKPSAMHNIPIWGIFLLFLGVVLLFQTLNILPWGLWSTLWRFWPVLIIAIGLGILLRRYNPWLVSALILVLFLASLGIAIWQYGPSSLVEPTTRSYSESLGSLESARIEIDFTAGSLIVGSLHPSSPNFVEVSETRNGDEGIRVNYRRQNGEGRLHLSTELVERHFWNETGWVVKVTRNIPLTIDVKSAVGNLDLDLSELEVTELLMDVDAGNYTVKMPSSAGTTHAGIKADVANVELTIPGGVAARLKADVNLGTFEVDESRFPRKGDYYISEDFESAENRIDLEVDCDIGRVEVK